MNVAARIRAAPPRACGWLAASSARSRGRDHTRSSPPRWSCRARASRPGAGGPLPTSVLLAGVSGRRHGLDDAAAAAAISACVAPASRRCSSSRRSPAYTRWGVRSTNPGTTVPPWPSTTVASGVSDTSCRPSWARPTKTMRPSREAMEGARDGRDVALRCALPRRRPGARGDEVGVFDEEVGGDYVGTPSLCRAASRDSPSTRTRSFREVVPLVMVSARRGRSSARARVSMSSALAAPSTGAAPMRTRIAWSRVPATPCLRRAGHDADGQLAGHRRRLSLGRAFVGFHDGAGRGRGGGGRLRLLLGGGAAAPCPPDAWFPAP